MQLWRVLLTAALAAVCAAQRPYSVQVELLSFSTPLGEDINGICCDVINTATCSCQLCTAFANCDLAFKICVEPMDIGTPTIGQCSTFEFDTGEVQADSNSVTFKTDGTLYGDWRNPQSFRFTMPVGDHYPGLYLKFAVRDVDAFTTDQVDNIAISADAARYPFGQFNTINMKHPRPGATNTSISLRFKAFFEYKDCFDLQQDGRPTGVYTVKIDGRSVQVFCDMTTAGGGWTVIQRRQSVDESFERSWTDYRNGFGNPLANVWLGLENIRFLTNRQMYQLRIELTDCLATMQTVTYPGFLVGDESGDYVLSVQLPATGRGGDSLNFKNGTGTSLVQNSMPFSTFDNDNDNSPQNCANTYKGGWWYNFCGVSNLNGKYYNGCKYDSRFNDGVFWYTWAKQYQSESFMYSAFRAEMKIRPMV